MKFVTFTGSPVRNEKFMSKFISFLTFTSIFNCWLVRVSYGVITSAPLFTFVVIFFSLALKGYFPYVMFNTLALLLLSILRGGGAF